MKRKIFALLAAVSAFAAVFSGCGNNLEEVTETSEAASETTTENQYILTRGWTGNELLNSIFYCGENRPLPMKLDENPDFTLSDGMLYFPDGSCAEAFADGNGTVTSLCFSRYSAPPDFSVYGIDFSARPKDIPEDVGFADKIYGDEETTLSYVFSGGGITELSFIFEEHVLSKVYIAS